MDPKCLVANWYQEQNELPLLSYICRPMTSTTYHTLTKPFNNFRTSPQSSLVISTGQENYLCYQNHAALAPYGFLDLLKHFKQRLAARNLFTYRQNLDSRKCRQSRCDYILSPDRRLFETVQIRKQRLYTPAHRMVMAKYLLQPTKSHLAYLCGQKAVPFKMPFGPLTELNFLFQQVIRPNSRPSSTHRPPTKAMDLGSNL